MMLGNRRRDARPELAVRRLLYAASLRYRVDYPALVADRRRRADVVFMKRRIVVFSDGCFWHGCPQHFVPPWTNAAYWRPKSLAIASVTSTLLRSSKRPTGECWASGSTRRPKKWRRGSSEQSERLAASEANSLTHASAFRCT